VLFSNKKIADYINRNFESSWQSVRPVPKVTIDFGNDTTVTRTLHGNIATYVCGPDANVLDVLPGVYDPDAYLEKLRELKLVAEYVDQHDMRLSDRTSRLLEYHKVRVEMIESGKPFKIAETEITRSTIRGVERSIKIVLNPAERLATRGAMGVSIGRFQRPGLPEGQFANGSMIVSANENEGVEEGVEGQVKLAARASETVSSEAGNAKSRFEQPESLNDRLRTDTRINEQLRRVQIHRYILENGLTTPEDMHKWLYREVLHADLDDPYLGLGKVLFEDYPFAAEDATTSK
jgi:hypothetical protein